MVPFTLHRGTAPLLISLPHDGTELPEGVAARLTPEAAKLPDTDWHVARLYAFAADLGASIIKPRYSRYLVDLNRPPDDASLYPGQNTTGLCPTLRFDGGEVYLEGQRPGTDEIQARITYYWRPYHDALREELERLRSDHGRVVVWDGHSIRGVVPFLFDGKLPDFNLGTSSGASCRPELQKALEGVLAAQDAFTHVSNGRFRGGYITRHYGSPNEHIDAVQLELAQANYMDEDSYAYDELKAARVQTVVRRMLQACL
jgi:N-formylglutamate deformylase